MAQWRYGTTAACLVDPCVYVQKYYHGKMEMHRVTVAAGASDPQSIQCQKCPWLFMEIVMNVADNSINNTSLPPVHIHPLQT
jgi:hypothetical protein